MNKAKRLILGAWVAMCLAATARGIVIEGTTPNGTFAVVGLDANRAFRVAIGTGTIIHVIVDAGTSTVFQGGAPWIVLPSTVAVNVTAQFSVTNTPSVVYPADSQRKQGTLCNNDPGTNIFIGGPAVSTGGPAGGVELVPNSCLSPDNPTIFTGALSAVSTSATASKGSYIYFK